MDNNLILNRLISYRKFKTDKELYEFLGVKSTTFSSWRKKNAINIPLIMEKFTDIDLNWLFRGKKLNNDTKNESLTMASEPVARYNTINNLELLEFYKSEYEKKSRELDAAYARLDKLIDKIGCNVSQQNNSGNNFIK